MNRLLIRILVPVAAATLAMVYIHTPKAACGRGDAESIAATRASSRQHSAIAIIVNKSNATESLSLVDLREYFLAERSHWPTKQKVRVAMGAAGQPERQLLLRAICGMTREQDFQAHFLRARFSEQTLEEPREFRSTPDVIRFVSNVPGAIGFVRADEVDPSVKVIRVEDLTPGDPEYKLKL
jgi:hypothetical protein